MNAKKKLVTSIFSIVLVICVSLGIVGFFGTNNAIAKSGDKVSGRYIATTTTDLTVDSTAGDFSIIAMGDQQIALGDNPKYVEASYDYIAENKDAMNLKMYINLGDVMDVVDFCSFIGGYNLNDPNGRNRGENDSSKYFWQQQKIVGEWVQILEDAEIPVAMLMGNHDYEDMATSYRIGKTFNEVFPISRWTPYQVSKTTPVSELDGTHYFGGAMYEDVENSYYYFNGNGQKYMVLVLGLHPSEAMIEWANQVVSDNSDCKVIVATHAYFKGGTSTYDSSERLWNTLLSKHENIIMSMCGHSSDGGNIVKKVNFGDNGNPVYQFMINTQGEEFGGLGVFAQIIFRANGDIDFAYYAPAIDTYASEFNLKTGQGRYFGAVNQFTLDTNLKEVQLPTTQETIVGNTYSGQSIYENYAAYSATNNKWLRNVYAYNNVEIRATKGLVTNGTGYVTYKMTAGEFNRFQTMSHLALGKIADGGIYAIDVSTDGVNFRNAFYNDSTITVMGRKVDIDRYVLDAKDLYVRIILSGDSNTYISALDMNGGTIQTVYGMGTDQMNYSVDFTDGSKVNDDIVDSLYFTSHDACIPDAEQILGTGDKRDNWNSRSMVEFKFESGEGRTFKSLNFSGIMKITAIPQTYTFAQRNVDYGGEQFTIDASTHNFKEGDSEYALKVLISVDGGVTYTKVKEFSNADNIGYNVSVSADLSSYVNNTEEVLVRLYYFGFTWNSVGFKNIAFNGEFNGSGMAKANYQLNGGTIYGDNIENPVKDGYKFDGWYLNSLEGEKVNASDYADSNVTLCAKWLKLSRITYILDGGVNSTDNQTIACEGDVVQLKNPTKEGYRFVGWFNHEGEKITSVQVDGSNVVLYAIWWLN